MSVGVFIIGMFIGIGLTIVSLERQQRRWRMEDTAITLILLAGDTKALLNTFDTLPCGALTRIRNAAVESIIKRIVEGHRV